MSAGEEFLPLPLSWSKLNQARRCSLAAWLDHHQLLSVTQKAPPRQETVDGQTLHRYAQFLLSPGSGRYTLVFPDEWTISPVFFKNLGEFFRTQFPALKASVGPGAEVFAELKLSLDGQLKPVYGWPNGYITGIMDLAIYNPQTQDLLILDYKSERNPKLDLPEAYRQQLELYAFIFHHGHAPVKRYRLVLHACFTGAVLDLTEGWRDFDPVAGRQNLVTLVTEALENLKTIKPTQNHLCHYCFAKTQCPLFK